MQIGYLLSSEAFDPRALVRQAEMAEEAGFQGLWISDRFHPWNDQQGHSGFVWSTIGAIAYAVRNLKLTVGVTCPAPRLHPAIVAQAAATSAVLMRGRFALGVGSGDALNEHILGERWPLAEERLEMLEEAVEVIRKLWQGGVQSHRGRHYRVDNARIYDLPERPPPIIVSGFGPESTELAARIGDGFCTVSPVADAVEGFRAKAGSERIVAGGLKVCWGYDRGEARRTAHRLWPNEVLPGELSQILPTPAHFEQACELVSEEMVAKEIPCGPNLRHHMPAIERYAEAGFDELYIGQIGPQQKGFFEVYAREILPRFANRPRSALHSANGRRGSAGGGNAERSRSRRRPVAASH